MKREELPHMTAETADMENMPVFPVRNLIDEIADPANISDSFDYVVSHLENAEQREHIKPKKAEYCRRLKEELSTGSFRITENDFRTMEVTDGPKPRIVQCPTVYHRIGCHAIMVPFEAHTYPTLIKNTAASIKGRGMHWLHQIVEDDMTADPEGMLFYYQSDMFHYYDSVSQDIMMQQVRQFISDPVVLPMLDNFIMLLDEGLSKGLRSSQCFANLHLSDVDHKMCEKVSYHEIVDENAEGGKGVAVKGPGRVVINGKEIRYHYYRYCDDIVMFAATKKELWMLRNYLKELLADLGLTIKPSEAVRPISEGLDFLGYKTYRDEDTSVVYSYIRKRTKQKFARKIKKVKSRKRRQSLIGSFFGMAAHADCRHFLKKVITKSEYRKLKFKRKMKQFENFKVEQPTLDGKKSFKGQKITGQELDRKGIIVVDFERGVVARRDREDYMRRLQSASAQGIDESLVEKPKTKYILSLICDGQLRKLWTGDSEIWQTLDQIEAQKGLPFFVGVTIDYSGQYKKMNFVPASSLGLNAPTDAELEQLERKYNIKLR